MARVRSRDSALRKLLETAPGALYALDDQRKIIYCNQACGELLRIEPDALVGQRSDYRTTDSSATASDIAASLCPPPEVFSGRVVASEMQLLDSNGALHGRRVMFHPLGSDELHVIGVLGLVTDREVDTASCQESAELHRRLWTLRRNILADSQLDELIGISPAIRRVREQVELALHGRTRVLVHGPSGSGREHVARLLHRRVAPEPFGQLVPLCCPLLDAELLQTTITTLVRQFSSSEMRAELPEAERQTAPTLLLLEVDQLSEEAQAELAGFLALPDFKLFSIATSQQSLLELAPQGRFRADLAHALSTLTIRLPALAQRPEDIPLLSQYFLEKFNASGERQLSGFSSEALDELAGYGWPDNIDELSELIEGTCRKADGPIVEARDLPNQIHWATSADAHPPRPDEPIDLDAFLAGIEKELLARALRRCKGNKTRAAHLLGMNRARFHRRLEHYGIS